MSTVLRWVLAVIAAAGLAIDAFTHLDLASLYRFNTTGTVNEGVLFRIEAGLAVVAAVWILVRPGLSSAAFTILIAGGGAFALLLYRYVDVGKIGPIPNMYEPAWFPEKKWALAGELIAVGAAFALSVLAFASRRGRARTRESVAV